MRHSNQQTVLFPALVAKPTHVAFDAAHTTSDGGALLLKAVDERIGLTRAIAACLPDDREPGKIRHPMVDLVRQRVFGLACGYEDANDVAHVGADPMPKLLLDRDPIDGHDLASQPSVSRFENRFRPVDLYRFGSTLMRTVIDRHRRRLPGKRARLITIDLDPTDDATHGQQQLSLFNGHYGNWCYLPMLGFVSFNDEAEQYLVAAVLRPGTAHPKVGAIGILRRLIPALRQAFPLAVVRVRLDGGFACPEIFDFLEDQRAEYLVAMARNSVLSEMARPSLEAATTAFEQCGQTVSIYDDSWYAARRWHHSRRVVHKAEIVSLPGREPRENVRFVVTNLDLDAEQVYAIYRQRGDSENRIKELKDALGLGRTSCHAFWANQLRVLLAAAAFVLMQELRLRLRKIGLASAQVETLRLRLLKIGGRVERSVRRVVVHLAEAHPWKHLWRRAALALGAAVP
jgi:hypothetical protein